MESKHIKKRETFGKCDWASLVDLFRNAIPESLITFCKTYELGADALIVERVYREDIDYNEMVGPIGYYHTPREEVFLNHFLTIQEVILTWKLEDKDEETGKNNLLKIAHLSSDPNGGLYIGIGKNNKDNIYVVNWDRDEKKFMKVCDSLSSFISSLVQCYN